MIHRKSFIAKQMVEFSDLMTSAVQAVYFVMKRTLRYNTIQSFDSFAMEQCWHMCYIHKFLLKNMQNLQISVMFGQINWHILQTFSVLTRLNTTMQGPVA